MITLVTGGNRGIGKEVCRQLHNHGFQVILTARDELKAKQAAEEIGVDYFVLDVNSKDGIAKLKSFVQKKYGRLDILINNAAVLLDENTSILKVDRDMVNHTIQTNALSPFFISTELQSLIPQGGQIIMVSSQAGGFCNGVGSYARLYSSSKTLLNTFTRHLAAAMAEKKIKVNAVCPGWVRTKMGGSAAPRSIEQGADTIVWLATGGAGQASGRFFNDRKERAW